MKERFYEDDKIIQWMEGSGRKLGGFFIMFDVGLLWMVAIEYLLRFKEAHQPLQDIALKGVIFFIALIIFSRLGWKVAMLVCYGYQPPPEYTNTWSYKPFRY